MLKMYQWNCCRTCLSLQSLNPIFPTAVNTEKYTNNMYLATGLKIEMNDALPQLMCSICINFVNEIIKFRKACETSHKILLNRLNNKQFYDVKEENHVFKLEYEKKVTIDISESISDVDDDFKDFDDNITLDTFQFTNNFIAKDDKTNIQPKQIEFESRIQDIIEKPKELVINTKKKEKHKRMKTKKDIKDKKKDEKRVREEIECEYCHKILTSKLSLRNHYKIHTGFDVVCEHCGKKFITRRLLLMHCRAKHGYEKTDKCSYCEYRASNAEQVKIHERLHTGERPYACKQCGAAFHRKSSYLQHIASHLPEKTVQCDQCPALFKSVTLMRIHKNRHRAPQYTFKCRVCDNSFARRRNVVRHLQRIHGLEADPQRIDRVKIG